MPSEDRSGQRDDLEATFWSSADGSPRRARGGRWRSERAPRTRGAAAPGSRRHGVAPDDPTPVAGIEADPILGDDWLSGVVPLPSGAPDNGPVDARAGDAGWVDRPPFDPAPAEPLADAMGVARPAGGRPVDPLLRRVGLITIAVALVVPVAMAVGADGPTTTRRTAPTSTAAVATAFSTVLTSAPTTTVRAAGSTATTRPRAMVTTASSTTAAPTTAALTTAASSTTPATAATDAPVAFAPENSAPATTKAAARPPATVAATSAPSPARAPAATAAPTTVDAGAAHAAAVANCGNTYEVRPGEYWFLLADRLHVSVAALLQVNAATVDTPLYPGSRICLPAGTSLAAPSPAPTTTRATTTTPAPTTTQPPATAPAPTTPPATAAPTTSAAPPTSTPADPPPANVWSRAQVEAIIREAWPDDLEDEALRIATRESNLNPTVRTYCCFGLFQIYFTAHRSWLAGIGVTAPAQLYDPQVNANAAYALYVRSGGWGPWAL